MGLFVLFTLVVRLPDGNMGPEVRTWIRERHDRCSTLRGANISYDVDCVCEWGLLIAAVVAIVLIFITCVSAYQDFAASIRVLDYDG